ncbi:MAG TPA: hypothetical protein PLG72_09090, partial [Clostridiales bacterium]|nr:hypothetical protein [Clostridiales bacterium]
MVKRYMSFAMRKKETAQKPNISTACKEKQKDGRKGVKKRYSQSISLPFARKADNQKAALFFEDLECR